MNVIILNTIQVIINAIKYARRGSAHANIKYINKIRDAFATIVQILWSKKLKFANIQSMNRKTEYHIIGTNAFSIASIVYIC